MKTPDVPNEIHDPANRVTYRVMAYRTLTRQELLQAIGLYKRGQKGKAIDKDKVVILQSTLGFNDC